MNPHHYTGDQEESIQRFLAMETPSYPFLTRTAWNSGGPRLGDPPPRLGLREVCSNFPN